MTKGVRHPRLREKVIDVRDRSLRKRHSELRLPHRGFDEVHPNPFPTAALLIETGTDRLVVRSVARKSH